MVNRKNIYGELAESGARNLYYSDTYYPSIVDDYKKQKRIDYFLAKTLSNAELPIPSNIQQSGLNQVLFVIRALFLDSDDSDNIINLQKMFADRFAVMSYVLSNLALFNDSDVTSTSSAYRNRIDISLSYDDCVDMDSYVSVDVIKKFIYFVFAHESWRMSDLISDLHESDDVELLQFVLDFYNIINYVLSKSNTSMHIYDANATYSKEYVEFVKNNSPEDYDWLNKHNSVGLLKSF